MRCNIPSRDLMQKLNGTVCMYDGRPVYILIEGNRIIAQKLPNRDNSFNIKKDDPLFDISSPPLGYMKTNRGSVYYLSRTPVRRSRQGLDERALSYRRIPLPEGQVIQEGMHRPGFLFTPGFVDMVTNNYPPLDTVLNTIRKNHRENPDGGYEDIISRNIGITINPMGIINVFLKNDLVGYIAPGSNVVQVPNTEKGWVVSRYLSHGLTWEIN